MIAALKTDRQHC